MNKTYNNRQSVDYTSKQANRDIDRILAYFYIIVAIVSLLVIAGLVIKSGFENVAPVVYLLPIPIGFFLKARNIWYRARKFPLVEEAETDGFLSDELERQIAESARRSKRRHSFLLLGIVAFLFVGSTILVLYAIPLLTHM